jgi:hypothetical protein
VHQEQTFAAFLIRWLPHVEQELLSFLEHLNELLFKWGSCPSIVSFLCSILHFIWCKKYRYKIYGNAFLIFDLNMICVLWCLTPLSTTYQLYRGGLSPLTLLVRIMFHVLDTLCDKVWQWLATGRWFTPGTPVSSTTKPYDACRN